MEDLHDEETRRVAKLLGVLVRTSDRSLRSLEQDLGLGSAGLSKILNGTVRLQLSHILKITEALGVEPGHFFRWAFPTQGRPSGLIQNAQAATTAAGEALAESEPGSPEFDEQVKQALLRLLNSPK